MPLLPDTLPAAIGEQSAPPGPITGNGFEVCVRAATDYVTVLAWIANPQGISFVPMLNDKGSGQVTLPLDGPAVVNSFIADGAAYTVAATSADTGSVVLANADAAALVLGSSVQLTLAGVTDPTVRQVWRIDPAGASNTTVHLTPALGSLAHSGDTVQTQKNAGPALLSYENLWQCYAEGQLVFEFLGETVSKSTAGADEQRIVTVAGPGTAQCLTWGRAMPPGWPSVVTRTDGIQDPFDVTTGLDTGLWNLSTAGAVIINPDGTAQITASPSGASLAGGPFDITTSSISAQIAPIEAGQGVDGSQVTQMYVKASGSNPGYAMIALSQQSFYCQVQDAETRIVTKILSSYDSSAHAFWRISYAKGTFFFWTSADGSSWVEQWRFAPHKKFDVTTIDLYFTAVYDVASSQTAQVTSLNSEVTYPSSNGNIFLAQPVMASWLSLLAACKARGTIPFVSTSFTAATDSALFPWTDSQSIQVTNGQDLFTLLANYMGSVGGDFIMRPGFALDAGLPGSIGDDLSQQIVFYEGGEAVTNEDIRTRDQIANMVAGMDIAGKIWTEQSPSSISKWGQREWWVDSGQAVDDVSTDQAVQAALGQLKEEVSSRTLSIAYGVAGKTPFRDFGVGDWVGLERDDQSARDAVRVIAIAITVDQDGNVTCELTLETYRQFFEQQMLWLLNKYGGQFASTLGALPANTIPNKGSAFGVFTTPSPDTGAPGVLTPTLGALADVSAAPATLQPNQHLLWNSLTSQWVPSSTPQTGGTFGKPAASLQPSVGLSFSVIGVWGTTQPTAVVEAVLQTSSAADDELSPGWVGAFIIDSGLASETLGMLIVGPIDTVSGEVGCILQWGAAKDGSREPGTASGIMTYVTSPAGYEFNAYMAHLPLTTSRVVVPYSVFLRPTKAGFGGLTGGPDNWTALSSPSNGWVINGYVKYRRTVDGTVKIIINNLGCASATVADGTTVFSVANGLPSPYYCPPRNMRLPVLCDLLRLSGSNSEGAGLFVLSTGEIQCYGIASSATRVDGMVEFPLDTG
jgi:hypothetical protein